jgi:hypothetical protein
MARDMDMAGYGGERDKGGDTRHGGRHGGIRGETWRAMRREGAGTWSWRGGAGLCSKRTVMAVAESDRHRPHSSTITAAEPHKPPPHLSLSLIPCRHPPRMYRV